MKLDELIKIALERLEHRYDADSDLIPGAPAVTWADNVLAEIVSYQQTEIALLTMRVEQLEHRAARG